MLKMILFFRVGFANEAERLFQSGKDARLDITRLTMSGTYQIPQGVTSSRTLLTLSRIPRVLLCFLISSDANTSLKRNIFAFMPHGISSLLIRYEGRIQMSSKKCQVNF